MIKKAVFLALVLIIMIAVVEGQVDPSWQRNDNIDAGESKPINFDVAPADAKGPSTTFNYNQHFNKTDFSVVPRVVLAQLVFAFPSSSSDNTSSMGYNITMGSINTLNFNFQVTTVGITIFGLHFIYFAVSPIYDGIYYMEVQYIDYGVSESVRDPGQGSTRTTVTAMANPQNYMTDSVGASQMLFQVWIVGYIFTPNGFINIDISAVAVTTNSYELTVIVGDSIALQSLAITAIMVNRTTLLEYSYTQYLDLFFTPLTASQDLNATSDTISDFNTQYFFRNTLFGSIGNDITISSFTFFYYNSSSLSGSTTPSVGMNERSRVCPANFSFYFYQNQTCLASCPDYYFTNTTFDFCIACHYSCQNCSNQADALSCIQCQAAMLRSLDNGSCLCTDGYFDNGTVLCASCDGSCLTCADGSSSGCLSCNLTANLSLVGGSCILDAGTCGDGLLASDEQCDDGNTINNDGCSSLCLIEPNHNCQNNVSNVPVSECSYAGTVQLSVEYVYKVPMENRVDVSVAINADGVNQQELKNYIESPSAVGLQNSARMLSTSNIIDISSSYDSSSQILTVSFGYTQDITLSTVSVGFTQSATSSYFSSTPSTSTTLTTPNNKLLTTFLADGDITRLQVVSYFFLGLVVLGWIFVIIGVMFGQTAVAVQWLLVLQIIYECLLQSQYIYQGYSGLVLFGKYSFGFNLSLIATANDRLTTIGLNAALLNTLNITAGVTLIAVLTILVVFIYEAVQFRSSISTDKQLELEQASTSKMNSARMEVLSEPVQFKVKRGVVNICLELSMSLVLLTAKIAATSFTISIITNTQIASSLLSLLPMLTSAVVVFLFYLASYNLEYLQDLSFRRLLRSAKEGEHAQLGNCLVKYHYFILYLLFVVFGILNGGVEVGIVANVALIIGTLIWGTLVTVNGHYLRKEHAVRAVVNCIAVVIAMVVLAVQGTSLIASSQTLSPAVIILTLLYLSFGVNVAFFIKIQHRRRRTKKGKGAKNSIQNVVMQAENRVNVTEEPLPFELGFQDLPPLNERFQELGQAHVDVSQMDFRKKESEESNSPPQTEKKPKIAEEGEAGPTQHKKWNIQRQTDPLDKTQPLQPTIFQQLDT